MGHYIWGVCVSPAEAQEITAWQCLIRRADRGSVPDSCDHLVESVRRNLALKRADIERVREWKRRHG